MIDLTLPMKPLAFADLEDLGRSAIPTLAPRWTDHNVHDPGVMMMELVAWIAEAQMYSISRVRRDERRAFAHFLSVEPQGPLAAQGLLWPSTEDPPVIPPGLVLPAESLALASSGVPHFFTSNGVQLTPASLLRVETRYSNGVLHDWTRVNVQQSATFEPFGDASTPDARLMLTFALNSSVVPVGDVPVTLGFEVVNAALSRSARRSGPKMLVSLLDADGERQLDVRDTTSGMLQSGVMFLPVGRISPDVGRFQLILRSATGGFERPPRIRQIGINVLPICQREAVREESPKFGQAVPNQQYTLQENGLMFTANGKDAVKVTITDKGSALAWTQTDDLQLSGPSDHHFELDTGERILTFGNGLNGSVVPQSATLQVEYQVSDGARGNLQPGVDWKVEGVAGTFVNLESTTGGADSTSLDDLRDTARVQVDTLHPLVTAGDVEDAAKSFADLGVTRAVELPTDEKRPPGDRVLVVTGPQDDVAVPILQESPEFLGAVRDRIVPRLPVGQRLQVIGPSYVQIRIAAELVSVRNTDPSVVRKNGFTELQNRLATVTANGLDQWPLGRPVSVKSVQGWLRKVDGVAQVQSVELRVAGNAQPQSIVRLTPKQLPSLQLSEGDLTVVRPAAGSSS